MANAKSHTKGKPNGKGKSKSKSKYEKQLEELTLQNEVTYDLGVIAVNAVDKAVDKLLIKTVTGPRSKWAKKAHPVAKHFLETLREGVENQFHQGRNEERRLRRKIKKEHKKRAKQ